jgi:hypothetical protein
VLGALAGAFLTIDLAFFGANVIKIADGGWVPLALGGVFILMYRLRQYPHCVDLSVQCLESGTHIGSFFGNAIADWSGVVVLIFATKYLYEKGSARWPPRPNGGKGVRPLNHEALSILKMSPPSHPCEDHAEKDASPPTSLNRRLELGETFLRSR